MPRDADSIYSLNRVTCDFNLRRIIVLEQPSEIILLEGTITITVCDANVPYVNDLIPTSSTVLSWRPSKNVNFQSKSPIDYSFVRRFEFDADVLIIVNPYHAKGYSRLVANHAKRDYSRDRSKCSTTPSATIVA